MGWTHLSIYEKSFMEIKKAKITMGSIYAENTPADILHIEQPRQLRILLIVQLIQTQPTPMMKRNLTFTVPVHKPSISHADQPIRGQQDLPPANQRE